MSISEQGGVNSNTLYQPLVLLTSFSL